MTIPKQKPKVCPPARRPNSHHPDKLPTAAPLSVSYASLPALPLLSGWARTPSPHTAPNGSRPQRQLPRRCRACASPAHAPRRPRAGEGAGACAARPAAAAPTPRPGGAAVWRPPRPAAQLPAGAGPAPAAAPAQPPAGPVRADGISGGGSGARAWRGAARRGASRVDYIWSKAGESGGPRGRFLVRAAGRRGAEAAAAAAAAGGEREAGPPALRCAGLRCARRPSFLPSFPALPSQRHRPPQ